MKRYQIPIAVVVFAMAVTACVKEPLVDDDNGVRLSADDFAFSIGNVATKASAQADPGHSFKLGDSGFYLEETVGSADVPALDTKGKPVYTQNIEDIYSSINAIGYDGNNVVAQDSAFDYYPAGSTTSRKVYRRPYFNYFWPEDPDKELYFFLRAPADYIAATTTDLNYITTDTEKGKITFKYTSKYVAGGADGQQDMIFTSRRLSRNQYFDSENQWYEVGAPVTFYHALTGVKFRNGHANDTGTKTIITKVKFTNLYDKGECTIDLSAENKVQWSNRSMTLGSFSQEFTNQAWSASAGVDGTVGTTGDADHKWNSDLNGTTWTSAAADKNLNDNDGSLTFWFIPQEISNDVKLEVTFRVKTNDTQAGTEITHTIDFGELLNEGRAENDKVNWKAGELRTYTLKPLDVDVDIFDSMNQYVKSGLRVTNTGNVDEYVRMLVIGNWYGWETQASKDAGDEPSILVGYTTSGEENPRQDVMVTPWTRWETQYGNFDSSFLGGELASNRTDWVRASGGYYYTKKIGPGEALPSTTPLFQTYTLDPDEIPTIYIPSNMSDHRVPAIGVHLVMEVVVQAIGVPKKENGHDVWWKQAWYDATGIEKIKPTAAEVEAHAND